MKVLGITGGIGSGKSIVLDYITRTYHARGIRADTVAHTLMEPGQFVYDEIVSCFGNSILNSDITIDRSKLGAIVFADREKLKKLNCIVHPKVKDYIIEEIEKERSARKHPLVVIEAALLIEDHYERVCNEFWYVFTQMEIRRKRLITDRGYTLEKVKKVIENQLTDEEYRKHCRFVIDNSSNTLENTFKQIDKGLVEHGLL